MADFQSVISAPAVPLSSSGLVEAAYFPSFGNRLGRAFRRFGTKPFTFLIISFLSFAFPLLAFLWVGVQASLGGVGSLLSGPQVSTVITALVAVTGIIMFLAIQAAIGTAAAFKVTFLRALGVGLSRSGWYLMTVVAVVFAIIIPFVAIIPNLVFMPRLLLVLPVVLAEKRHGWQAMVRSRDLVAGHTLRLGIELFFLNLLTAAVTAGGAAAAPTMISWLSTFLQGPFAALLPFAAWAVAAVVWVVCQLFFMPLNLIYLQIFYEDCIKEKGWEWEPAAWRIRGYQLLAILGLAIVIGVPSFGGWQMLRKAAQSGLHVPAPLVNFNLAASAPAASPTAAKPAETAAPAINTPAARDLERYEHLSLLKIALASYQSDQYVFPAALAELVPKYLSKPVADPLSQAAYAYVGATSDYQISFTLEEGVFALAAGTHTMSSRGFDLPTNLKDEGTASSPPVPADQPSYVPTSETAASSPTATDIFAPGDVFDSVPALPAETVASEPGEQAASSPANVPTKPVDTDGDLLSDGLEKRLGTNPNSMDTDGDGLSDAEEVLVYHTDPLQADTDGDGFGDKAEVTGGYNPRGTGRLPAADLTSIAAMKARLRQATLDGLIIDSEKF
jgi:hypothetical protein